MTKYYVDDQGNYIGGFDGVEPPAGAIEVPSAPDDARQVWNGNGWGAAPLTVDDYRLAIETHVDDVARQRDFRHADSARGHISSTVQVWRDDAEAFIVWADQVWLYAFAELAKVQAGERAQPTVEEFIAELPALTWPA